MSDTPNYDRLIRAHAETGQRPVLTRSLDAFNGTDRGWNVKFVCGRRGTKNRWEYVSGYTVEDAARKALDMRAKIPCIGFESPRVPPPSQDALLLL